MRKQWKHCQTLFSGAPKSLQMVTAAKKLKDAYSLEWRRQIEGENVETVADFIFLGSKVIVNGDCSQEIKRRFLHGRKAVTNLDSILKSKVITLPTKIRIVKL